MITRYATATGSVYDVDDEQKQIRRVYGTHPPTEHQGIDGEWKGYHALEVPGPGGGILIHWNGLGKGTLTSKVLVQMEQS